VAHCAVGNQRRNIFHRQDRFEEALAHYERAYAGMIEHRDVRASPWC